MLGEHRHHLVGAVARALLEQRADLVVLARAHRLGEHPVGHVADQDVTEAELALSVEGGGSGRGEDVLLDERRERVVEIAALGRRERAQGALPEGAAENRCLLNEAAFERVERVEPRGQHRLNRVGEIGAAAVVALLRDAVRHLLREQRVAAGSLGHGTGEVRRVRHQHARELARCVRAERLEGQAGRVRQLGAEVGAAVEQLVAGEADDHERSLDPAGEVLDGVEHAVVRPVDVLEGHHERSPGGDRLHTRAERREERLAQALGVALLGHELGRAVHAERPADQGRLAVGLGRRQARQVAHVRRQLRPGRLGGVGVHDAALGAQDLGERPVDDAAAVGEAAPGADRGRVGTATEHGLELAQEARLAYTRLAEHGHELRPALLGRPLEERLEGAELGAPADERRSPRRRPAAERLLRGEGRDLPGRHGRGLALQLERLERLVDDRRACRAHRALADGHAAGARRALKPGGDVHGVARDRVGLADRASQHLAGVDADAQLEAHVVRQLLVHLDHGVLHPEARAHGALGVVLVGHGRAEEGHHVVADELVDGAAVALDLGAEPHQHAVDERLHALGIEALGERGVARQVGEQHGHLAPLLRGLFVAARRRDQRAPAVHTEARLGGVVAAASRAGHGPEIKGAGRRPCRRPPSPRAGARRRA